MQEAIQHLDNQKIYHELLGIFVVPLVEAEKAVAMTINKQLEDVLNNLQKDFKAIDLDFTELENEEEND